jgi:hypothetical protein
MNQDESHTPPLAVNAEYLFLFYFITVPNLQDVSHRGIFFFFYTVPYLEHERPLRPRSEPRLEPVRIVEGAPPHPKARHRPCRVTSPSLVRDRGRSAVALSESPRTPPARSRGRSVAAAARTRGRSAVAAQSHGRSAAAAAARSRGRSVVAAVRCRRRSAAAVFGFASMLRSRGGRGAGCRRRRSRDVLGCG